MVVRLLTFWFRQFGNILVLTAVFSSPNPQLSRLVDEDTLRRLLGRTIHFLDDKAPISPALAKDAHILRCVQSKLFPSLHPANSANSSFSSNR